MQELAERSRRALAQLPLEERVVLALRVVEGMPVGQVARHLGIPEEGVRALQLAGLRRMRAIVDERKRARRPGPSRRGRGSPHRRWLPA